MDILAALAVLSALTLLFILFSKWRYQYWDRMGAPQLEPELIFGDYKRIFQKSMTLHDFFIDIYKKGRAKGYKHIGLYNTLIPEWMPLDINLVKQILTKDFAYFPGHGTYRHKNEPLSNHLFSYEGKDWKDLRIKLTPAFTSGKLKMMFENLIEKTHVLKEVVTKHAETTQELHIKETLARFTTDVIGNVAFGLECNCLQEGDNKFRTIGRKAFEPRWLKIIVEEVIPHNLLGLMGYKSFPSDVTKYFTDIVKDAIKYRETNNIQRKDFMQLMLQLKEKTNSEAKANGGEYITDEEIVNESFLFYLAGFETSSSTSTSVIIELAHNQDVQEKLRQEIHDILEQNDGKLTYDAIMQMEYLDKVVCEALRKYPPVTIIPRVCGKDYKVPGTNTIIKKGTRTHIVAMGIQRDPEYFPDPEKFNPENFSPENKANRPDFAWIPFGEGPRMCIGLRFGVMQSKAAIVTLIQNFKFLPHEKTPWPLEFDNSVVILTVKGNVCLKVFKV